MPKQFGFTFVELLVVIAVIGVLGSVTLFRSASLVTSRSLLTEAESLASKISYLQTNARASQTTIRLACGPNLLTANFFTGVRSNTLSQAGGSNLALDAKTQTDGLSHQDKVLFDGVNKLSVQCPSSCGDIYISSEGYILTSLACGSIDFIFTKNASTDSASKLSLSNMGYPRIFMQSPSGANSWNELLR